MVADLKAGRCCVSPGRFDLMLVRAAKMWPKGAPLPKFVPMTITLPIRRDNHGKKGRDDD